MYAVRWFLTSVVCCLCRSLSLSLSLYLSLSLCLSIPVHSPLPPLFSPLWPGVPWLALSLWSLFLVAPLSVHSERRPGNPSADSTARPTSQNSTARVSTHATVLYTSVFKLLYSSYSTIYDSTHAIVLITSVFRRFSVLRFSTSLLVWDE